MTKQLCDSSVIANNARKHTKALFVQGYNLEVQELFVQGYNLEVHGVIMYMRKHRATVLN